MLRWFTRLLLGGVAVVGLSLRAASPGELEPRLRAALRMPTIELRVQMGFDSIEGFDAWDPSVDPAADAARLEKTLTGGVSDAAILEKIARLQNRASLTNAATATQQLAVKKWREFLAERPDDPERMAKLGAALGTSQPEEAEKLLRSAVGKAPNNSVCQLALSQWLYGQALLLLTSGTASTAPLGAMSDPATRARVRKLIAEANEALDRAVEAAPDQLEPRLQRAAFLWGRAAGVGDLSDPLARSGDRPMKTEVIRKGVLPDLRKAEELAPQDFRIFAMRLWLEATCDLIEGPSRGEAASEASKRQAVDGLNRLQRLAEQADSSDRAAAIWEVRALMQMALLHDATGANESAARALALQPARSRAWALRAGALQDAGNSERLIEFLEGTLQRTNTVRVRLILAKVYEAAGRSSAAADQIAAALRLDPQHLVAQACELTLQIRQTQGLDELRKLIDRTQDYWNRIPGWEPADDRPNLMEHIGCTTAIALGLTAEWTAAKELISRIRQQFPESDYAQAAGEILLIAPK